MADIVHFRGFAGIRLEAASEGRAEDPLVLLVHGTGQSRAVWHPATAALVAAGRRVVSLDLRGHGGSQWPTDGRYDVEAFAEDLRAVLSQLDARPVIVATTLGAWIALAALTEDSSTLAAGLVLVDLPTEVDAETTRRVRERLRSGHSAVSAGWDQRVFGKFDVAGMPQRIAELAPRLTLPVLLVQGGLSEVTSNAAIASVVAALPDAETAQVPEARLLVADSRIDEFSAILLDFLERRQPRAAPAFRSGSDPRTLRDALGCFATGVTIVTAVTAAGAPIGLTANSFTSVSLDPPLLLVCVANNAGSAAVLTAVEHFAVNVLQIGQQPASNRFSGKGEDRFTAIEWAPGERGAPVLAGSLGVFECERHALHEGGDHFILVGRVHRATFEPRRDPLLYFRGRYRRLHFG